MKLHYKQPASLWEQTLAIGNGSLGAMIWGGITKEQLGLNEESLWSGYPHDKNNPDAFDHLEEARQLIHQEKYEEAEVLIRDHMLGEYNESYLPLGNVFFEFSHKKEVSDYNRILDIEHAIAQITYQVDNVFYKREYFASYPSRCILIKLTCTQPLLDFNVSFSSQIKHDATYTPRQISISGQCPEHIDPSYINSKQPIIQGIRGKKFQAALELLSSDGFPTVKENSLCISHATSAIFAFHAVKKPLFLENFDYEINKKYHIKDYKSLYDTVTLYLGKQLSLPTDERLSRLRQGKKDNGLYGLYFQYGRYLMISSSRAGSLPPTLQGIWNWELRAPWSSNFTTNINTQMNYWPAQTCNLSACLEPYFTFLKRICFEGKKTAMIHYHCKGFVHHHNADYWCSTNPVGLSHGTTGGEGDCVTWSFWPMGGAWLTSELFRHYEYHLDIDFLKETAYPILREACLFLIDWTYLYEGHFITCPSTSPENRFQTKTGGNSCVTMSCAMDLALILEVFENFKKTCEILEIKDELLPDIKDRVKNLTPFQVGSKGQLLEWNEEFEEMEPGHRHVSHLYGLFPSELFAGNKELTKACQISLQERLKQGSGHTGWSCAWILNLFAILQDEEQAFHFLHQLLTHSTYDNLWDAHPPFQIDGNFGGIAGIANMLVQDRNNELKLLPALPKEWKNGYVKGLRIKNGKTIDITWRNHLLQSYHIY